MKYFRLTGGRNNEYKAYNKNKELIGTYYMANMSKDIAIWQLNNLGLKPL